MPSATSRLTWDSEVSRLHAQLEPVGPDWTVVDDGLSRNGTFVNGERVNGRRRLRDGDRLVFGDTPVTFRAPADATDSTAAVALGGAAPPLTEAQRKIAGRALPAAEGLGLRDARPPTARSRPRSISASMP